ncbi:MAG TPA: hypothetical protein VHA35_15555 [Dongiaceae bacterium]|jgi:hypothetical protein|nr:hypothetical protein [Dongiaceae bacterium]
MSGFLARTASLCAMLLLAVCVVAPEGGSARADGVPVDENGKRCISYDTSTKSPSGAVLIFFRNGCNVHLLVNVTFRDGHKGLASCAPGRRCGEIPCFPDTKNCEVAGFTAD